MAVSHGAAQSQTPLKRLAAAAALGLPYQLTEQNQPHPLENALPTSPPSIFFVKNASETLGALTPFCAYSSTNCVALSKLLNL